MPLCLQRVGAVAWLLRRPQRLQWPRRARRGGRLQLLERVWRGRLQRARGGECVSRARDGGGPGGRHCVCDEGHSGSECAPALFVGPLPYGQLVPGDDFCRFAGPEDCPVHPVFNLSSVAVLDVTLPAEDLVALTDPRNRDMGWLRGVVNVTFIQGPRVVSFGDGAMKLGGSYSKRLANKGWEVKGGRFGAGVRKLKTKSGVNGEPRSCRVRASLTLSPQT